MQELKNLFSPPTKIELLTLIATEGAPIKMERISEEYDRSNATMYRNLSHFKDMELIIEGWSIENGSQYKYIDWNYNSDMYKIVKKVYEDLEHSKLS